MCTYIIANRQRSTLRVLFLNAAYYMALPLLVLLYVLYLILSQSIADRLTYDSTNFDVLNANFLLYWTKLLLYFFALLISMSDDDHDIDIESDDGDDSDSRLRHSNNTQYYSQAEKRAHHNALERKRRDHIKDSFTSLRDVIPSLQSEKVASRAQILKKSAEYIQFMRRRNISHQQDIEDLKRQNTLLESQIRALQKAIANHFANEGSDSKSELADMDNYNDTESESSESETGRKIRQPKKLKVASLHQH